MKTNQQIHRVYGLRGCTDFVPTLIEYGPIDLMAMDAPDVLPAGSMCFDARNNANRIHERVMLRGDGAPAWRQGSELWINGTMCHRARTHNAGSNGPSGVAAKVRVD